jgi:hypothetical protein
MEDSLLNQLQRLENVCDEATHLLEAEKALFRLIDENCERDAVNDQQQRDNDLLIQDLDEVCVKASHHIKVEKARLRLIDENRLIAIEKTPLKERSLQEIEDQKLRDERVEGIRQTVEEFGTLVEGLSEVKSVELLKKERVEKRRLEIQIRDAENILTGLREIERIKKMKKDFKEMDEWDRQVRIGDERREKQEEERMLRVSDLHVCDEEQLITKDLA